MSVDVDRILLLLDPTRINKQVLLADDEARETFRIPDLIVRDAKGFKLAVTEYVRYHLDYTGMGRPSEDGAFGEAKGLLDRIFSQDPYQEGYNAALQMSLDGAKGGLRQVLNELAEALKRRHLQKYMDHVFYEHVDPLSKEDNYALSRAFFKRFGPILRQFGVPVDEDTFAWNTRAALDYHRQAVERILDLGKKV